MLAPIEPVSYDIPGAGQATGLSADVIRRAVNSGDLTVHYPEVDGQQVNKPLILVDDLRAWVLAGKAERVTT